MFRKKEKPIEKPIISKIAFYADGTVMLGERKIGFRTTVGDKKVYVSDRNKVHHYKKMVGFGIIESVVRILNEMDCEEFIMKYTAQDGKIDLFVVPKELFIKSSIKDNLGENEPHKFLELKHWKKV
jgi:hypothetical protein